MDFLFGGGAFWGMDAASFMAKGEPLGFEWTDASKKRARVAGRGIKLFEGALEPVEVLVDFAAAGAPERVTFSLFNRGDMGEIPKAAYDAMVKTAQEKVGTALAVPMTEYRQPGRTAVKIDAWIWKGKETAALLESSAQSARERDFKAEFIRLKLAPPAERKIGENGAPQIVAKAKLLENIRRDENGDVWIDNIPMVDQGQKGYCVVASCQRLLEFYGLETDQHELAQVAEADEMGTSAEGMMNALDRIERRMKLDVRDHMRWDYKDFIRVLDVYDRMAKEKGVWRPKHDPRDKDYIFFEMPIYQAADPDVLREAKCSGGRFERFEKIVRENIEVGTPLLWTLMLGVYPEDGEKTPQSGGGHMRIISGYNTKTSELIFTDSWGAGHERKRMKMKDAFAATTGVYGIAPRR